MPGAQYRIRSRVKAMRQIHRPDSEAGVLLSRLADMIDEEIERDAEFEFTRPLNPDPITNFAKENKK